MRYEFKAPDLDKLRRSFEQFSDRRFAAGLATGLTRTAQAVQKAEIAEMRDVFDRPTPRTLGAIFVERATAQQLRVRIGVADNPFSRGRAPLSWLQWQIRGGRRQHKAFEQALIRAGAMPDDVFAVPGRFARLDAFGNISAGQIRQILSQLRIELSSGATSVLPRVLKTDNTKTRQAKERSIRAAYKRAGGQYVAFPYGRGKLPAGVYQVRSTAFGRADPRPVLIYVSRADYEAERFDFDYVADLVIRRQLGVELNTSMADQLRRWAAKYREA